VAEVLEIARQCHGIIMTNFAGTLGVDAAGSRWPHSGI